MFSEDETAGDADTADTEVVVQTMPTEVKKKKKKTTKGAAKKEGQDSHPAALPPAGFAERDSGPSELTDEVADEFAQPRDFEQGSGGAASKVQNVVTYIADTVAETVANVASVIPGAQVNESEEGPEKTMSSKSGKVVNGKLFAASNALARIQSLGQRLYLAAAVGDVNLVEELIQKNANLEECGRDGKDQLPFYPTPLQAAAFNGQDKVVELLLDHNAKIEALGQSEGGNRPLSWTALHLAAHGGHSTTVELLLSRGAEHKAKDCFHRTPLEVATGTSGLVLATKPNAMQITRKDLITLLEKEGQNATEIIKTLMVDAVAVNEKGHASVEWKGEYRLSERLQVVTCPRYTTNIRTSLSRQFPMAQVLDSDLDLKMLDVNLLYFPEVKVVLKALPYFEASLVSDREVLGALASTGNEATLATDTVQAMIAAAWAKVRNRTAAEIMLNTINVSLLCYVSVAFRTDQAPPENVLYILIFIHMKMTLEELAQQVQAIGTQLHNAYMSIVDSQTVTLPPFLDIDQLTDLGYQILGCTALFKQIQTPEKLEKPFMALFSAMAWFRFCYSLRGEPWFGPRILPILFALRDTVVFFFFFACICVCAATHAHYNLAVVPSNHDYPLYASILQVVRLGIFGDFDLFEFEGADGSIKQKAGTTDEWEHVDPEQSGNFFSVHVLFYGVGLGITILLMNVLIGVLGSNFDLYQDRAPELFNRARAKLLLEIEGRPMVRLLNSMGSFAKTLRRDNRILSAMFVQFLYMCGACIHGLFHFVLLLCALPVLCILTPFCSWSGTYHTFVRLLKAHLSPDADGIKYIWVVQRECTSDLELRSLHALVKEKVNEVNHNVQGKLGEMNQKIDHITKVLQRLEKGSN